MIWIQKDKFQENIIKVKKAIMKNIIGKKMKELIVLIRNQEISAKKRLDYHDYKRKDTYRDEGYRGNYQKAPYGNRDFNQGRGNYYPNRNNQKY